jgi:hypothetical protein
VARITADAYGGASTLLETAQWTLLGKIIPGSKKITGEILEETMKRVFKNKYARATAGTAVGIGGEAGVEATQQLTENIMITLGQVATDFFTGTDFAPETIEEYKKQLVEGVGETFAKTGVGFAIPGGVGLAVKTGGLAVENVGARQRANAVLDQMAKDNEKRGTAKKTKVKKPLVTRGAKPDKALPEEKSKKGVRAKEVEEGQELDKQAKTTDLPKKPERPRTEKEKAKEKEVVDELGLGEEVESAEHEADIPDFGTKAKEVKKELEAVKEDSTKARAEKFRKAGFNITDKVPKTYAELDQPAVMTVEGDIFTGDKVIGKAPSKMTIKDGERLTASFAKAAAKSGKEASELAYGYLGKTGSLIPSTEIAKKKNLPEKAAAKGVARRKAQQEAREKAEDKYKEDEKAAIDAAKAEAEATKPLTKTETARLKSMMGGVKAQAKKLAAKENNNFLNRPEYVQIGAAAALKHIRSGSKKPFSAKFAIKKQRAVDRAGGTAKASTAQKHGITTTAFKEEIKTEKTPGTKHIGKAQTFPETGVTKRGDVVIKKQSTYTQTGEVRLEEGKKPSAPRKEGATIAWKSRAGKIVVGQEAIAKAKKASNKADAGRGQDGIIDKNGKFRRRLKPKPLTVTQKAVLAPKLKRQKQWTKVDLAAKAKAEAALKKEAAKKKHVVKKVKPLTDKQIIAAKKREKREVRLEMKERQTQKRLVKEKARKLEEPGDVEGLIGVIYRERTEGRGMPARTTLAPTKVAKAAPIVEDLSAATLREKVDTAAHALTRARARYPKGAPLIKKAEAELHKWKDEVERVRQAKIVKKGPIEVLNNEKGGISAVEMFNPKKSPILKALKVIAKGGVAGYTGARKLLSVEAPWIDRGHKEVGTTLKNYFGIRSKHQQQGIHDARGQVVAARQDWGREPTKEEWRDIQFVAEDQTLMDELTDDSPMKKAALRMRKYFDQKDREYKARGVNYDWKATQRARLTRIIIKNQAKFDIEEGDTKVAQQAQERVNKAKQQLEDLKDLRFVHIPIKVLYETATNKRNAKRLTPQQRKTLDGVLNLFVEKKRTRVSLKSMFESANEKEQAMITEMLNPASVIMHYAHRYSKDMAVLDIRDSLIKHGLAKPIQGNTKPKGWEALKSFKESGVLAGHYIDSLALKTIADLKNIDMKQNIYDRFTSYTKMTAFINPWFLPMYDAYQSVMAGSVSRPETLYTIPKNMAKAWRASRRKDNDYLTAMELGLFSKPFDFPWNDFQGAMKDIMKSNTAFGTMAARTWREIKGMKSVNPENWFMPIYHASWNTAWGLDETVRMFTYYQFQEAGMEQGDAAQLAAQFHGDYAGVPPKTRKWANRLLFTPTFKIAMTKLYGRMIYNTLAYPLNKIKGKDVKVQEQFAVGMLSTIAVKMAFDAVMKSYGFKPDEDEWWNISRKYVQEVATEFGPKELVFTWSNPGNITERYLDRVIRASRRARENPGKALVDVFKWDLHPVYRTMITTLDNRKMNGDPIWNENDDPYMIGIKMALNAATDIVRLGESLEIETFLLGDQKNWQQREVRKRMSEIVHSYATVLFDGPFAIMSGHLRDIEAIRVSNKLKGMQRNFNKTQKQYFMNNYELNEQWMENYIKRLEDEVKRLEGKIERYEK